MATPIQRTVQFSNNLPLSGPNRIDSLLQGTKWGGGIGTGVQGLEYSFVQTTALLGPNYDVNQFLPKNVTGQQFLQDFQRLTPAQVAAANAARQAWADVANITFVEVIEPGQLVGNLEDQRVGDIRFARSRHVNDNSTATSQFPDSPEAGDMWFSVDTGIDTIDPATGLVTRGLGNPYIPNSIDAAGNLTSKGTYDYQTFIHEIGHALGLKHPHNVTDIRNVIGNVIATPDNDVQELTVMSYRSFVGQALNGYNQNFYPTTPMLNDIEAIQYLYGPNLTTRTGNNVYNWRYFTQGTNPNDQRILQTIWDAGGIDTIDWSDAPDQTSSVRINLNGGEWSELGNGYTTGTLSVNRTVAIARDVTINGVVVNAIENATGGGGKDELIGNQFANVLNGGSDTDTMRGGQGDDTYYVDNIGDNVIEIANEGTDIVFSSITYTLGANLENLTLTGNSIINGTGNYLDNIITGNDASNTLDGKAGNDILYGNAGNDTILGDDGDDKLIGGLGADILNGGNGIDFASYFTATTGVTASLIASQNNTGDAQGDVYQFIENLEGSEYGDSLFGDNQSNILIGLGGDDFLDGFGGNDTLLGGKGSDTYKVYSAGDVVTEYANEGADTVNAAISYMLGANIENLNLLEGTASIDGTGNELNNIINGNSANNIINGEAGDDHLFGFAGSDTLIGGDGSDWLTGGQGNDILTGGNGNDFFVYNAITDAGDRITDFTVGSDKIVLTEVVNSSGFRSSNLLADGFFSVRSAGSSMAAIMIDPDGAAGSSFRSAPFLLLNNVSATALNNSSNFMF